jgi:hypothetical protein
MASLTKTQLEHAKSRVATAMAAYIHRQMASIDEEPDVQEYDNSQKLAMIRSGTATLKAKYHGDNDPHGYLTRFYDYTDTPEMTEARAKLATWKAARDKIDADAAAIEAKLIDELVMSPDGTAALERIAAAFAG